MKFFVIFAASLAVAQAGVGTLNQREEQDILRLFFNACSSGSSEGSVVGDSKVFCKLSTDTFTETQKHKVSGSAEGGQKQVIFVQPPSYHYNHKVEITGNAAGAQGAKIYVLPQKNKHTVEPNFQLSGPGAAPKPTVYFLRGEQNGGAGGAGSGAGGAGGSGQSHNNAGGGNYITGPGNGNFGQQPSGGYGVPQRSIEY